MEQEVGSISPDRVRSTDSHAPTAAVLAAGIAGNVIEWYDFAVYGFFAATLARLFFPAEDPTVSLIASFGAFAAGFLARPLGGLFFGHIGDRFGRRTMLLSSVSAMLLPTCLIALLPTYEQIGFFAPALVVLLRLLQGISVGGEYTSSVIYLVEHASPRRRGLDGSLAVTGSVAGILLGSAVGAALNTLCPPEAFQRWGWRLAFLLGLPIALLGLHLRRHLPESPVAKASAYRHPVAEALRAEWAGMLRVVALAGLSGTGFYLAFVYLPTWLHEVSSLPASVALRINTLNMLALLLVMPVAGALSDHIGRRPVLLAAAGGLLLCSWPLFSLMRSQDLVWVFLGQLSFALLVGLALGAGPATMVEIFRARTRCSALSIGYNVSLALFGGTAPMVATYLIHQTQNSLSPAYYLMATAGVALATTLSLPKTAPHALE